MITHLRFCGIPRYERNKNKLMTNTHCSCYIHLQELRHCFSVNLQGRGHAFLLFIETCSLSLSYQFYLVLLCSKAETSSKLDPLVWDPLDSSCLLDLVFHRWRHMGNCRFDWKGTFRLKKIHGFSFHSVKCPVRTRSLTSSTPEDVANHQSDDQK